MCDFRGHCLHIRFDVEALWIMLARHREQQAIEELQRELIRADAPQPLMKHFYGMTTNEYADIRRQLGLQYSGGRLHNVPELLLHRVWREWDGLRGEEEDLDAESYLSLHQRTGVSLRSIWAMTREWLKEFPGPKARRS